MQKKIARVIAFYLPQFHPIPENDLWGGSGFTEWTHTTSAKRLFRNHYQPRRPANLGFYDLRVSETRDAQARMAQENGIEGFCYWHYWFAGKRLMDRPLQEVMNSGSPKLSFCLGWANHSWVSIWKETLGQTIIKQSYPGREDVVNHFFSLLDIFRDKRYICIEDKPLFVIYRPHEIPNLTQFIDLWNSLAKKEGLPGIYFIGHAEHFDQDIYNTGLDAVLKHNPGHTLYSKLGLRSHSPVVYKIFSRLGLSDFYHSSILKPHVFSYEEYIRHALTPLRISTLEYPCVVPSWDNTPRYGVHGSVLHGSSPMLFQKHLRDAIRMIENRDFEKRIIFLKSWNEWAEGNYIEPDQEFGLSYLEACKKEICFKC